MHAGALLPPDLSACWEHHIDDWGGRYPDIALLEYAVNDFGESAADMEALLRVLLPRGTLVVLLHHFTPAFMLGGGGYKGSINATGEYKHERLARHYDLSSVSVGEAMGLSPRSLTAHSVRVRATDGTRATHGRGDELDRDVIVVRRARGTRI